MVTNGDLRAADYTNQRIAERWHAYLSGPANDEYQKWLRLSPKRREAEWAIRAVRSKIELWSFKRQQSTR